MRLKTVAIACVLAVLSAAGFVSTQAHAQDNWTADGDIEARKIERYQSLVDKSPEESYAFKQLMQSVGRGTAYEKLVRSYEDKVAKNPTNFNLRMVLGHIYKHGGNQPQALASYREAAKIRETALVVMSIAAAEVQNRHFPEAVEAYEKALTLTKVKTERSDILRALAEIALYRRHLDKAEGYFEQLIALEPNSLFLRRELAQIYASHKLYTQARDVLKAARSKLSATERDQLDLDIGGLYEQEGNDSEALKVYRALEAKLGASHWMQREISGRIIDIHRRTGEIEGLLAELVKRWRSPSYEQHLELADLYDETQNPEAARGHLLKAIAMNGRAPEAHEKLVAFYRGRGQLEEALRAREALIKAVPDNPQYRFDLFDDLIAQKRIEPAMSTLDKAQKDFATKGDVLMQIAELYQIHGRSKKALAIYEAWLKRNPNDTNVIEALGDYYDIHGQQAQAMATWKRIEKVSLDKATKLETMARIYEEHGYFDEAEGLYAQALKADPKDCQAIRAYAEVLTRNANQALAIENWQRLLQTCPSDASLRMAALQIATIHKSRGSEEAALTAARTRAEAADNDAAAQLFFAQLALALSKPSLAVPALEAFAAKHPDDQAVLTQLYALHAESGDFAAASESLKRIIDKPGTGKRQALLALAELQESRGELEAAQANLEAALDIDANDAASNERLGEVLQKMRKYARAAHYFEAAFDIDPSNFVYAFKHATTLTILGRDEEADDIYVKIVVNSRDESLIERSARRAIDDHSWRQTLDTLEKQLNPLTRAMPRRPVYASVLMRLASAQAQPHILAVQTRPARASLLNRHALRELGGRYARTLVESLLSDDVSAQAQALELSLWLPSASVVAVLNQKIASAPSNEGGRQFQLKAIRAIAYAQLPSAIPALESLMQAHFPRAIREHAVWALGLISDPLATKALVKALDIAFDSYRAIAIIGLGRQNERLDLIEKSLNDDPSPRVRDAAAWALAYHRRASAKDGIRKLYGSTALSPHQLWAYAQFDDKDGAKRLLEALWYEGGNVRDMAARLMTQAHSDLRVQMLTQAEAQMYFADGDTTHYASNFDVTALLEHFVELSLDADLKDTSQAAVVSSDMPNASQLQANEISQNTPHFFVTHRDLVIEIAKKLAQGQGSLQGGLSVDEARTQMLRDLVDPTSDLAFNTQGSQEEALVMAVARSIEPHLSLWMDGENEALSGLALRLALKIDAPKSLDKAIQMANAAPKLHQRLNAIDALAEQNSPQARASLLKLAKDPAYLVRATVISKLNPAVAKERQVIENATADPYKLVSDMAKKHI